MQPKSEEVLLTIVFNYVSYHANSNKLVVIGWVNSSNLGAMSATGLVETKNAVELNKVVDNSADSPDEIELAVRPKDSEQGDADSNRVVVVPDGVVETRNKSPEFDGVNQEPPTTVSIANNTAANAQGDNKIEIVRETQPDQTCRIKPVV